MNEDKVNNSGKQAKWIKSEIPNEQYVCSLCGACWKYDYNGTITKSRFCPNCGAEMIPSGMFLDIDEAITFCRETYNDKSMSLGKYKQIGTWLKYLKVLLDRDTARDVLNRRWVRGERGECPKCKTPVSRAEDRFHCGTCGQRLQWFQNA